MPIGRPMGSAMPCPLSTHAITATVPAIRAVEYPNMRPRVSHGASRSNATNDCQWRLALISQPAGWLSEIFGLAIMAILDLFCRPGSHQEGLITLGTSNLQERKLHLGGEGLCSKPRSGERQGAEGSHR